jgi:type I restriction enzyme S subunit
VSSFADEIILLRNVGTWSGGGTPSKAVPEYWDNGDIPWVSPKDMKTFELHDSQDKITAKAVEASPTKLVPAGSVLMVVRSGILAHTFPVAIARRAVTLNQDMKAITPKAGLSSEFLAYQLLAQVPTILNSFTKSGTTVASVETKQLQALPFWVPSTELQSKIVEELEKQLSRLETTVTTLQGIQAKLKQARASILKAAVEGRLVETEAELARRIGRTFEPADHQLARINRKPTKKRPIPEDRQDALSQIAGHPPHPEGWALCTLGDIGRWTSGGTPSRRNPAFFGGSIPWIKTGELNDSVVTSFEETITTEGIRNSAAKLFPAGTLLVAMYGATIGITGILGMDASTNQACAALLPADANIESIRYLQLYLQSQRRELRDAGQGGAQPNISLGILKDWSLCLPPITEQKRIVAEVGRRLSVLDQVESTVQASLARCALLRQAILKRAFEGRLVPAPG